MTEQSLSEENRTKLMQLMNAYLRSEFAAKEIEPTMWLSAVDFTFKLQMQDLSLYAKAMFYKNFQWHTIHTNWSEADKRPGSGRRGSQKRQKK